MTALALARAGGGAVEPDLVLPPGFDRVGDVLRFEQEDFQLPSGELERSQEDARSKPTCASVDPCKGEGATLSPATDRCGPGLAPVEQPGRIGLPGAVASRRQQACSRCHGLGHKARTCVALTAAAQADVDADPDCASTRSLKPADKVPCTRCGLRGHVAGDPDRCLYYHGSLGLGGQSDQARGAG